MVYVAIVIDDEGYADDPCYGRVVSLKTLRVLAEIPVCDALDYGPIREFVARHPEWHLIGDEDLHIRFWDVVNQRDSSPKDIIHASD